MRVPRKGLLVEMWRPPPPVNIRGSILVKSKELEIWRQ